MTPTTRLASWENVAGARSMTRPGLCASRSSTVQWTDAPVETSVTVTTVPKARVGLAQVPALASYHDARPVEAWGGAGGGDATGFGAGTGDLGATTADTETAATGFEVGAGAGGGGGVVVVVVGRTCRNETLTTRV
jgi:hypothetical protein